MKKKIIALLISIALTHVVAAEEDLKKNVPEDIIPTPTDFFLKVVNLQKTLKIINTFNSAFQAFNPFQEFNKIVINIKNKTGIDLLNDNALKKIGVNTGESLCLSSNLYNTKEHTLILIPVSDKKNFPLTFIKILKQISDKSKEADLNPVITEYRNYRVSQVLSDIFYTIVDDYFVITSNGELLKKVIDLKTSPASSLNSDPQYQDYLSKNRNICDINIFMNKSFLSKAAGKGKVPGIAPNNVKDAERKPEKENNSAEEIIEENAQEKLTTENKNNNDSGNSYIDCLNYMGLGLKFDLKEILIEISMSANTEEPDTDKLLKIFATGLREKAIFIENPVGYHYLSFDIKALNDYIKIISEKNESVKENYNNLKEILKNSLDLSLEDDLLECFGSVINIAVQKSEKPGTIDKFILFMQMQKCSNSENIWDEVKDYTKKKYGTQSGEEKIGDDNSFWFIDERGKTFILLNNNNYYIGNDVELIKNVITNTNKNLTNIKNGFTGLIDNDTFFFSYTRFDNESFMKAVLTMLILQINPSMYGITDKIENISFIGKKNANHFSFDLDIKIH